MSSLLQKDATFVLIQSLSYELEIGLLKLTPNFSWKWCDKPAGVSVSFSFSLAFLLDFGVKEFHNNLDTFSGLVVGLKVLLLWVHFLILVDGSGVRIFNCFLRKRFVTMIVFLCNFTFTSSGIYKRFLFLFFSILLFSFSFLSPVLLQFSLCLCNLFLCATFFSFCLHSITNVNPCFSKSYFCNFWH